MLKRHEVEILLKAGHAKSEVARLAGVSLCSVKRIAEEAPVAHVDDAAEREKRRIGRPSKVENFRKLVVKILQEEPDLPSLEILRRIREAGYQGGKTALYALVASLRPQGIKPLVRFEGLPGEFSQHDFGQVDIEFLDGAIRRIHFFASRLKYSRYIRVSRVKDETVESLVRHLPDFVAEGRSLILYGKTGRGKTHLAVAIGYRAIQNDFETLFTTAAELIEDLSNASKKGHLQESLATYTHPHVLVIDEVGYLTYGPDAAYVLFHVVNDRHLRKRPMIFTTNKPMTEWGKVLHDEDMAAAILDRVLERGRFIHLDGPSGRTRHLNLEETLPENTKRLRISGIGGSEFPEPTGS